MPIQDNTDYIVGDLVVTKDDRSMNTFWIIVSRNPKAAVPVQFSGKYTSKSAALKALGAYDGSTMQRREEDLSD